MKLCDIPFSRVLYSHPNEMNAIIATLRKSKSMHRNCTPEQLSWSYGYCVRAYSYSPYSMEAMFNKSKISSLSLEERVEDRIKDMSVWLSATKGRWYGTCEMFILPIEAYDTAKKWVESNQ